MILEESVIFSAIQRGISEPPVLLVYIHFLKFSTYFKAPLSSPCPPLE